MASANRCWPWRTWPTWNEAVMESSAQIAPGLVGLDPESLLLEEPREGVEGLGALAAGQVGGADLVGGADRLRVCGGGGEESPERRHAEVEAGVVRGIRDAVGRGDLVEGRGSQIPLLFEGEGRAGTVPPSRPFAVPSPTRDEGRPNRCSMSLARSVHVNRAATILLALLCA